MWRFSNFLFWGVIFAVEFSLGVDLDFALIHAGISIYFLFLAGLDWRRKVWREMGW